MVQTVNNHPNYSIDEYGNIKNIKRDKQLKPYLTPKGYYKVVLNGTHYFVHRLVALNFIPNPDSDNLVQVNHIDGNKLNNHIDNLEWVTCKKNINHAVESGLTNQSNDKNNHSKLTKEDVIKIRQLISEGMMQKDVAKLYNMSTSGIYSIYHKITWKDV